MKRSVTNLLDEYICLVGACTRAYTPPEPSNSADRRQALSSLPSVKED